MNASSTPHAPFGAGATFDLGPAGAPAGFFPTGAARPAQAVFIGCRHTPEEPWSLLPFFTPAAAGPQPLPKGRYGRFLAWAGDKWMIGPLVFKLCTPFSTEPSGNEAFRYAPVVCAYLEYDNTHSGATAELIFGFGGEGQPLALPGVTGFTLDPACGYATGPSPEVSPRRDHALFDADIGPAHGLHFTVPPHAKRIYPLVLGFHAAGFFYDRFFADLPAVLSHGLAAHANYLEISDARDAEFMRSALPFEAKGAAALAVRQWLAQTRRLAGEPEIDLAPLRALCATVRG